MNPIEIFGLSIEIIGLVIALFLLYSIIGGLVRTRDSLHKSFIFTLLGVITYIILKIIKLTNYFINIMNPEINVIISGILGVITFLFFAIAIYGLSKTFKDFDHIKIKR